MFRSNVVRFFVIQAVSLIVTICILGAGWAMAQEPASSVPANQPGRCVKTVDSVTLKDGSTKIVKSVRCEYAQGEVKR